MHYPTLQELQDANLLTWEQVEEIGAHLRGSDEVPYSLLQAVHHAWLLWSMDEGATVH